MRINRFPSLASKARINDRPFYYYRSLCNVFLLIFNFYMSQTPETLINELFEAGSHVGYSKTRRHPSTAPFIFESRQKKDVIDLAKTVSQLDTVLSFLN